jgi:hypothetical protein
MFSAGEGVACPKCMGMTDTPEEDVHTPENDKLEILEQKLQESESKLETTVVVRDYVPLYFIDSKHIFTACLVGQALKCIITHGFKFDSCQSCYN